MIKLAIIMALVAPGARQSDEEEAREIAVSNPKQLREVLASVEPGYTVVIKPGRYKLKRRLEIRTDAITIRGETDHREDVVLDGGGVGELVAFTKCTGVTVADLTIENVKWNGFKINSETGVHELTIDNCVIHNVWQRGVKGVMVPEKDREKIRPRGCVIRNCLFYNDRPKKFSDDPADKPGRRFNGNYIGAIDVMYASNWTISDNVFRNIQGRTREGRGAIFLWHEAEGCVVERNLIVDCDKGICLGNSYLPKERGIELHARNCIVRNNFVTRAPEAGILAAHTGDCRILHNTVHDPRSRMVRLIRILGEADGLVVAGNLLSGPGYRNESKAKVTFQNNLVQDMTRFFKDPKRGDLRLRELHPNVRDKGRVREEVTDDIDGRGRAGRPDIGAHEYDAGTGL